MPGTGIYVDGDYLGVTDGAGTFYTDKIPAGRHALRFEKDGYITQEMVQEVSDLTSNVSVYLEAQPVEPGPASSAQAYLFLDTNVGGAVVFIDGRLNGQTGGDGKLMIATTAGSHRLRVEKDGYQPLEETLSVSPD